MKKSLSFLSLLLLAQLLAWPASAADILPRHKKVIWIDQQEQWGAAYEKGKMLVEFPILSGDDETPSPPGVYVIKVKDRNYYSRKYKTPMPFSIFYDFQGKRAIHEGEVPKDPEVKQAYATHGCIHVEEPYIKWLFDWTEVGKTVVIIKGQRDDDQWQGEDSGQDADTLIDMDTEPNQSD